MKLFYACKTEKTEVRQSASQHAGRGQKQGQHSCQCRASKTLVECCRAWLEAYRGTGAGQPEEKSNARRVLTAPVSLLRRLIHPAVLGLLCGLGFLCPAMIYLAFRLANILRK